MRLSGNHNADSRVRCETIAFVSGKGGVGKTIIVANLAALIAKSGIKTLLIDSDFGTRGLTFYTLKGEKRVERRSCYFDYLMGEVDIIHVKPIQVQEDLYLLAAISSTFSGTPEIEEKDKRLLRERFERLLHAMRRSFDVIIIDTRSGADPYSLLPAALSDRFVIVSEEDFTSWRASILMSTAIEDFSNNLKSPSQLTGFILNRVVGEQSEQVVSFLESRLFETKMLAVLLHEANVKRAFLTDDLVIERFPGSKFSSAMWDIACRLFQIRNESIRSKMLIIKENFAKAREKDESEEHKPLQRLRVQSILISYLAIITTLAIYFFRSEIMVSVALAFFLVATAWSIYDMRRWYHLFLKKIIQHL